MQEPQAMLSDTSIQLARRSCKQDRGPAPVAADLQLQRRLAGRQAEQRVPELIVAKHAVLVAVWVSFDRTQQCQKDKRMTELMMPNTPCSPPLRGKEVRQVHQWKWRREQPDS